MSLLQDLNAFERNDFEVILTFNVREEWNIDLKIYAFPLTIIYNDKPKGFAENHNAAFRASKGSFFVFLNPDIRLPHDPFDSLIAVLEKYGRSICAPKILNPKGEIEDSARGFPSPWFLMKKLFRKVFGFTLAIERVKSVGPMLLNPDWVAGMFIMVPSTLYSELGGLNENYFLYYEDVDFCARARRKGVSVFLVSNVAAVHMAQRDSHRRLRYTFWHLRSALRFFISPAYLYIAARRVFGLR
ncbi:glycosyltransferase [Noviherbaspirillum soli]|uniref:glycosyltransferase n=1 Tax=Noviherbaspirillum soli TaxID=1064518 RepID=UPI00188C063A|nr:glycosyltransferase [Noviherbaspirillum soli]